MNKENRQCIGRDFPGGMPASTAGRLIFLVFIICLAMVKGFAVVPDDFVEQIDLDRAGVKNVIVLPLPDKQGQSTVLEIVLPEFSKFCHVAADSNAFRWIGASNRMFPWIGNTDLNSVFESRDPVPPLNTMARKIRPGQKK